MSNKTRLQTNNTNLQALINKANTLPDAGGGSGGGLDVCSVTINHSGLSDGGYPAQINYTTVENGTILAKYTNVNISSLPYTINNCLCRSSISIYYSYIRFSLGASVTSDMNILGYDPDGYGIYLSAPTTPNTAGTITIYDDD